MSCDCDVMCLFIITKRKNKRNSKKRNIKSRKIDKRERKMLVSKRSITRALYKLVYLIYSYRWSVLATVHPTLNDHMYSMRLTCGIHIIWCHFVLESSTSFSQVLWSMLWPITSNPNPTCSKNRKIKINQKENENEEENKKKQSLLLVILIRY